MKALEEKTLKEIIELGTKEDIENYYLYLEHMKTNSFYRNIVDLYPGDSLVNISRKIIEEEEKHKSEMFFPGDITMFYPRIKEQKARDFITCDFSGGIIYPGRLYVNYRPLIYNINTKQTYVLQRTLKVEIGYIYELPTTTMELEALDNKIRIDNYDDSSGIQYSHLSQCLGGEITLQKLKRRNKK